MYYYWKLGMQDKSADIFKHRKQSYVLLDCLGMQMQMKCAKSQTNQKQ